MADETKKREIAKLSLRHGLLIGGISIVLSIIFRVIDPMMQFTNLWITLLVFVTIIALLVIQGIDVRKKVGGYWSFGEAFQSLIIMALIIAIFNVLFGFVLFKFIDPELPEKISAATQEVMTKRLEKMGMDQDKIDEVSKTFENGEFKAKLEPTFKNEFSNFGFSLLIYAVINLIIAACIKKNKPLYATDLENATDPTE